MISPGTAAAPRTKKRDVGVPKFLRSLFEMLETEDTQIISWTVDGSSVQVLDRHTLENKILPKYFKHSKFTSFQRQLNYFGFKKNTKFRSHMYTFTHPYFRQNRKDLLCKITRHYGNEDDNTHASADENDAMDKFLENETPKVDELPFSSDPLLHLNSQDLDTLMCIMDPEDDIASTTPAIQDVQSTYIETPSSYTMYQSNSTTTFITAPNTTQFNRPLPPSVTMAISLPQLPTNTFSSKSVPPPVSPPSNFCYSPTPNYPVHQSSDRIESMAPPHPPPSQYQHHSARQYPPRPPQHQGPDDDGALFEAASMFL